MDLCTSSLKISTLMQHIWAPPILWCLRWVANVSDPNDNDVDKNRTYPKIYPPTFFFFAHAVITICKKPEQFCCVSRNSSWETNRNLQKQLPEALLEPKTERFQMTESIRWTQLTAAFRPWTRQRQRFAISTVFTCWAAAVNCRNSPAKSTSDTRSIRSDASANTIAAAAMAVPAKRTTGDRGKFEFCTKYISTHLFKLNQ